MCTVYDDLCLGQKDDFWGKEPHLLQERGCSFLIWNLIFLSLKVESISFFLHHFKSCLYSNLSHLSLCTHHAYKKISIPWDFNKTFCLCKLILLKLSKIHQQQSLIRITKYFHLGFLSYKSNIDKNGQRAKHHLLKTCYSHFEITIITGLYTAILLKQDINLSTLTIMTRPLSRENILGPLAFLHCIQYSIDSA